MKIKANPRPLTGSMPGGTQGASVVVEPLEVGTVEVPPDFLEGPSGRFKTVRMLGIGTPRSNWQRVPCSAFLVTHPSAGPFLVDTGLHPSVSAKPSENLGRIAARFARPELAPGTDLPAQLRTRGLEPRDIRTVVMTHLHVDHASGMSEFGDAAFVVTEAEWDSAVHDSRPLMLGYRHAHYDYAFDYRTLSYDGQEIDSYSTFGRTFDLFGDGSVRLAYTPGHSAGHQSVICRLRDRDLVIAGDAIYTLAQLGDAQPAPRPYDGHNYRRSLQELRLFRREHPEAVIIPGHDRAAWDALDARYE
jgi:glyoxylase-like metal-dependent hydrolase (beta-lactamase superfamily II)